MKLFAQIARYLVGVLFIFSGLIKLNDPSGTEIKLEEYFEVFATDMPSLQHFWMGLIPYALYLAVIMCVLEVVLGVALLVLYKVKTTSWLLLILILFFTFLTFYSAYFNKVTDCGCFGDFIKLKPWTSFGKDVFLLVLILVILYYRSIFTSRRTGLLVSLAALGSLAIAFFAITHLPPIDFLPYKIGANIPAQMQPSAPLRYKYIMEKNGKTEEFEKYPTDTAYHYKEMILVNEEARPKITDYKVWNNEGDYTQETFKGKKLFIIIKNSADLNSASLNEISKLVEDLKGTDIQSIILSSKSESEIDEIKKAFRLNVPSFFSDATVLKTISRSNPGIWLLNEGTVKGKWHYNDTPTKDVVIEKMNGK